MCSAVGGIWLPFIGEGRTVLRDIPIRARICTSLQEASASAAYAGPHSVPVTTLAANRKPVMPIRANPEPVAAIKRGPTRQEARP